MNEELIRENERLRVGLTIRMDNPATVKETKEESKDTKQKKVKTAKPNIRPVTTASRKEMTPQLTQKKSHTEQTTAEKFKRTQALRTQPIKPLF